MINLAVINLKGILKKIFKFIILIIIIGIVVNNIKSINLDKINIFSTISEASTESIEKNISIAKYFEEGNKGKESNIKKILEGELALFLTTEEKLMEKENQEEVIEFEENEKDKSEVENPVKEENNTTKEETKLAEANVDLEKISTKLDTKIIDENNKTDKYTDVYKTVKIKNESKYNLTESMVTPNYDLKNKKDIIIFHTHTCESYTKSANANYEESGNFRTIDLNYNVAAVGTELRNNLNKLGYNVMQSLTYHDYPAYTGSYNRSLKTVKSMLEQKNDTEFIIDLHRDALGSNSSYGPKVKIGDESVAQLMFVIGTDGGGLEHPNWNNNLKNAIKIQEKANEMYPGLFKPIILRNSRYNQNVSNGACIIEVGATGNTIEECKASMKYLSKVIAEVMK